MCRCFKKLSSRLPLTMTWQWHCNDMKKTWQWHGNDMTMTWQLHDNDIAMTWQWHEPWVREYSMYKCWTGSPIEEKCSSFYVSFLISWEGRTKLRDCDCSTVLRPVCQEFGRKQAFVLDLISFLRWKWEKSDIKDTCTWLALRKFCILRWDFSAIASRPSIGVLQQGFV